MFFFFAFDPKQIRARDVQNGYEVELLFKYSINSSVKSYILKIPNTQNQT